MKFKKVFLYSFITLAGFHGQGVVVARKRSRSEWSGSGTTESTVFAEGKNGTKIQKKEIEKFLERHPDPRDPAGVSAFYEKQYRASCLSTYRIVVDNKDSADCK